MFAPSKPVLIAIAGVAGLAIVIGGVLVLRQRARPPEEGIVTVTTAPADSVPTTPNTPLSNDAPVGALDATNVDTDGDGLTDQEERQIGTNIVFRDTDGDGVTDYDEVRVQRTNPLLVPTLVTTPTVDSSVSVATTTTISAQENGDRDGDGLRDRDEVLNYQTNPDNPDTDGDSFLDGPEVQKGYNPRGPGACAKPTCLP